MRLMETEERDAFRRWCAGMTGIGQRSRSVEEWMKVWVTEKPRWNTISKDYFGIVKKELAVSRKNETLDLVLNDKQKQHFITSYCKHSENPIQDFLSKLDFVICLNDSSREIKIIYASLPGQLFLQPFCSLQATISFLLDLGIIVIVLGELDLPEHDKIIRIQNTDYSLKMMMNVRSRCSLIIGQGIRYHLRRMETLNNKTFTTHTTGDNPMQPNPVYKLISKEIAGGSVMWDMEQFVKRLMVKNGVNKWISRPKIIQEMWGPEKDYKTREQVAGTLKDIFYRKTTSLNITERTPGLLFRERRGSISLRLNQ